MLTSSQTEMALQRAQAALQIGRTADAWALIAPLRKAIDHHGQALRLYALIAQGSGEVDAATGALRRIITIEREPPEIVGALADMLGNAGKHDEALPLWTRLTQLQPGVADAHLNRAICAADAGKHELAIEAAQTGLARFPGHPRLLATKAMALKNAGQIEEAVVEFERAVAADPNRALTRHNQAVALRAICRFDDACEAFEASERLGMKGAQFHANWAAAALEAERIDQAIEQYQRALADDPAHPESMIGLTRLQVEYRGGEEAFAHFERNATTRNMPSDWLEYANILMTHRHHAKAAEIAGNAIERFGEEPDLVSVQAYASGLDGDAGDALRRLETFFRGRDSAPLGSMAMLSLRSGDPHKAAALGERLTELHPVDQGAWMLLSLAWRLTGDPREQWLCDYDRLVMVTEATPPDGSATSADYAREVAAILDPLHQTSAEPGDQSLRGGTQTSGSLLDRLDPGTRRFRAAIIGAAEEAIASLPDDPTHPFLRRRREKLNVVGSWSVRLAGGSGHHVSHFHNAGWMSSAYYARLPTVTPEAWSAHEGWIQFGAAPDLLNLELPPRRIVEPKVGRLVLFPSYMLHGTLPFGAGDRLTAAFDFQPA
jgi:tetratricopeptide (TPR) repeat protein